MHAMACYVDFLNKTKLSLEIRASSSKSGHCAAIRTLGKLCTFNSGYIWEKDKGKGGYNRSGYERNATAMMLLRKGVDRKGVQSNSASCTIYSGHRRQTMRACRGYATDAASLAENNEENRSSEAVEVEGDTGEAHEAKCACLYVKKSICEGEIVEHSGAVIILGDVKKGGSVSADGDVVVLGKLQGNVHAGRAGNLTAKVFASRLEHGEIRISNRAASMPRTYGSHSPQIALLSEVGSLIFRSAVEETNISDEMMPRKTETCLESMDLAEALQRDPSRQNEGLKNTKPARVALVTGLYISIAGLALITFPKSLFGILFNLNGVSLGWVQVGAVLAMVFGVYYIGTAVGDMRGIQGAQAFYYSTVVGRIFLFLSFSGLVSVGAVPPPLLIIGIVNLLGAISMLVALKK